MSTELSCHNIRSVRAESVERYPQTETRPHSFASRRIVATDDLGHQFVMVLYAESEEQLLLHDASGECIERMPDPPDCTDCRGQGMIAGDEDGTPVTCPSCNGEGVLQS
jgi:hypothetical protein